MSAHFFLLLLASESGKAVVAPEVLDLERLQQWLAGSVWALIGLNLFALALFLTALVAPQIHGLKQDLIGLWTKWRDYKKAQAAARDEALKLAKEKAEKEAAEAKAAAEALEVQKKLEEQRAAEMAANPLNLPPIAAVAPPPPPPPAPTPPAPPPPTVAVPEKQAEPVKREPFGVDEKTEVLDTAQIDALLSATPELSAPTQTQANAPAPTPTAPSKPKSEEPAAFSLGGFEASLAKMDLTIKPPNPPATAKPEAMIAAAKAITDKAVALDTSKFSMKAFEASLSAMNLSEKLSSKQPAAPAPEAAPAAAEPAPAASSSSISDKTEEIPRPTASALQAAAVSGETKAAPMGAELNTKSASAFERSLDQLLDSSFEKTEELPIFDSKAIEDALKDVIEEDPPR